MFRKKHINLSFFISNIYKSILITLIFFLSSNLLYTQQLKWKSYYCGKVIESIATQGKDLWVSTDIGFAKIDLTTDEIKLYDKLNTGVTLDIAKNIYVHKDGTLFYTKWFTSGIGYFYYNLFQNIGIGGIRTNYITFDKNNDLWLGTYNGLECYSFSSPSVNQRKSFYVPSNSPIPGEDVVSVQFDSKGNIWVACFGYDDSGSGWSYQGGVAKFDGKNWTVYTKSNSPIPTNRILCLAVDKNDNVWVGTENGYLLKLSNGLWTTYAIPDKPFSGFQGRYGINALAIDSTGNIWAGTIFCGLYKLSGNTWTKYKAMGTKLASDYIQAMVVDYKNNLWIGTMLGLFKFDGQDFKEYSTSNSNIPGVQLNKLLKDSKNNLWFICNDYGSYQSGKTTEGVIKFDGNTFTYYSVAQLTNLNDYIRSITEDYNGNIWVATNSGLLKYDYSSWTFYKYPNWSFSIIGITSDYFGNVWMITSSGDFVKFNGNKFIYYIATTNSLPNESFSDVKSDGINIFAAYKYNQKYIITLNSKLSSDKLVYSKLETPFSGINTIQKSKDGSIWIGSEDSGLAKYDGKSWFIYQTTNSQIPSNNVRSINFDSSGKLLIACWDSNIPVFSEEGVALFDGTNFETYKYSKSSLPLRSPRDMIVDNNNNIWILSYSGLSVYNNNGININFNRQINNSMTQNFPNPFNSTTLIQYSLSQQTIVQIKVYNILGEEIATLIDKNENPGNHIIQWNGKNKNGAYVTSGIYLYRIKAGDFIQTKKMIILK